MGISISNQLLGSTGLSVGRGLSRGNGLSFNGFAGGPALYLPFALTGTLDPRITFSRPSLATLDDGVSLEAATLVLSINFLSDTLDQRITFSRPSLATYDDGVAI